MRVSPQKLSALVQVEKEVTRGGRTHTQHYWVRGGEEIRAAPVPMLARGKAEKPPTIVLPSARATADGEEAIERIFGFRVMSDSRGETYEVPQPWCRSCRSSALSTPTGRRGTKNDGASHVE